MTALADLVQSQLALGPQTTAEIARLSIILPTTFEKNCGLARWRATSLWCVAILE